MKRCSISGCEKPHSGRGYCQQHYMKWYYHGDPLKHVGRGGPGRESPNTLKATKTPTLADLHWAAGFLDGEGCFTCAGGSQRVCGSQKDPELLYRLLAFFGGRIYQHKNQIPKWEVCGSRARGVMMTLYPMLSTRRQEKIRLCLKPIDIDQP